MQILNSGENYSVLKKEEESTSLMDAFRELHFPTTLENLEKAKNRIGFENLIKLASLERKIERDKKLKNRIYNKTYLKEFIDGCPYTLTEDQSRSLSEISDDMMSKEVMNRLLLGDVGSGKTLVAFGASYLAIKSGYQTVVMCPTEILAEQHYESAIKMFGEKGINVGLLHSKLSVAEKNKVLKQIRSGEIQLLISTHSSLSDKVEFKNLGLVITDEQHRFGVKERAKIETKGESPDVLVMSATPIPRSLSLVLFGGLKVSEIKSRPAGESKIKTNLVPSQKEKDMWSFILKEVNLNAGKCFVIVPRIEETGESSLHSVDEVKQRIVGFGVDESLIEIIHGKTDKLETAKRLESFKSGSKKILISTTIVEVGIDVKSANLMVIYNGERFGLATLHQLRGRIGRDGREGYCFVLGESSSEVSLKRLEIFKKCNNGIALAEEDLKIRGAGTLYGTKQHGANEIFLNINFSLEEYQKAKQTLIMLSEKRQREISNIAENDFGEIYKNVVLN